MKKRWKKHLESIRIKDLIEARGIGSFEKDIEIELTNRCNAACVMCPRSAMQRPLGEMTRRTLALLVERCRDFGIRSISLNGFGEPMLHSDYFDFAGRIKKHTGAILSTTTNVSLLPADSSRRLLDSGIDRIIVSFNGAGRETYERAMPPLSYERAVRHMEQLLETNRAYGREVVIDVVRSKINEGEVDGIIDFWYRRGVEHFVILVAHNRAARMVDPSVLDEAFYDRAGLDTRYEGRALCARPSIITKFVNWEGGVHICCNDLNGEARLGDIRREGFEAMEARRTEIFRASEESLCAGCNMPASLMHTKTLQPRRPRGDRH